MLAVIQECLRGCRRQGCPHQRSRKRCRSCQFLLGLAQGSALAGLAARLWGVVPMHECSMVALVSPLCDGSDGSQWLRLAAFVTVPATSQSELPVPVGTVVRASQL